MKISEKDKKETIRVSEIINKINNINEDYVNSESDEIYHRQPFLISLILGYRLDLKAEELEEITKVIFMIWEYFKDSEKIRRNKVTEIQFEKIHSRNIHLLKYFEGEPGQEEKLKVVASDILAI